MQRDHVAIGRRYAEDVVAGRITVCKWVTLACQRHLDDLSRQRTSAFPYRFDDNAGGRVCRFIELFEIFEGPLAGNKLQLLPWQCWLLTNIFGWLNHGGPRDGKRRFRRAYIEVSRGNGKSALSSALALYMLAADGEGGSQVVAAGTSRDVAKIVFSAAQQMAQNASDLMQTMGIEITAHAIIHKRSASSFKAISADSRVADGKNLHAAIIDELHLHRDRRLYDSLETGTAKRDQSLLLTITTAGTDTAGICYEVRTYVTNILDQKQIDESTFGVIYTIPDGMDWRDPEAWAAANPSLGITVMPEVVAQLCEKAKATPAAQNNFRTKMLCEWCSADSSWMDMGVWRRGHDDNLRIEDFEGQRCYIGLDLASKIDLASKSYIFPIEEIGKKTRFAVFTQSYLPENTVRTSNNSQYSGWEIDGSIITTPGDVVDFAVIERDIIDDLTRYDVVDIGYDPTQATYLVTRLQEANAPLVEVRPNVMNFSEPMKELQSLALENRLIHNDSVLTWCISNVVCHPDKKDNLYPNKQRVENKIDPVVALITAFARYLVDDHDDGISIYETQPLFVIG